MQDLISRQAAIDAIGNLSDEIYGNIEKGATFPPKAWFDGMAQAQSILENLPSAQPELRWIPVSERLPEPRVDVWVNSDIGQIQGYYEEHVGVWYASFGQGRDYLELIVNAWMPLPEPYREEGEDKE